MRMFLGKKNRRRWGSVYLGSKEEEEEEEEEEAWATQRRAVAVGGGTPREGFLEKDEDLEVLLEQFDEVWCLFYLPNPRSREKVPCFSFSSDGRR